MKICCLAIPLKTDHTNVHTVSSISNSSDSSMSHLTPLVMTDILVPDVV